MKKKKKKLIIQNYELFDTMVSSKKEKEKKDGIVKFDRALKLKI